MAIKTPEQPSQINRAVAWTSTIMGVSELLPILAPNQPVTYEAAVSADLTQRSMAALELYRRNLMDPQTMFSIIVASHEIHKYNDSTLPPKRRRSIVHDLIKMQDHIIEGYKYA